MRFTQIALLLLASSALFAAPVSIDVLDATVKDKRVSGATVLLQQNGEQTVRAETNANGKATLNSRRAEDGDTLLIIKKEGYSDLAVKCPCNGLTYALSPVMKNLDGMRIVLTWGEEPEDMDSHLVFANSHIYFDKTMGNKAWLDVDDVDSFGPETITIEKKIYGTDYIYAVHDFSGKSGNGAGLPASGAKVFVYVGQSLVKTYSVPTDKAGTLWTVFRLNKDGDFEDINRVTLEKFYGGALVAAARQAADTSKTPAASGAVIDMQKAEALNKQGENAYHSKRYAESIVYYLEAISFNETYAQAWSNLGLSYLRLNLDAECIWANRKAIYYASGDDAKNVRASSFYNIAKLYEQNGDFNEALRYYELAKQQKANTVYDKAIKRVKGQL